MGIQFSRAEFQLWLDNDYICKPLLTDMKRIDYFFSALLILLSAGHGIPGTLMRDGWDSPEAVWSFSGSVAAWLVAAINILRTGRPEDKGVAVVALLGSLSWIGLMVWLAIVADMVLDIRIWLFVGTAAALAGFGFRTLRRQM